MRSAKIDRAVLVRALIAAGALFVMLAQPVRAASLDMLDVEITSESVPQLCAEKDNVAVMFRSKNVAAFRIEAAHPTYIHTLGRDSYRADWTACDLSGDAKIASPKPPRKVTLYEDTELWVTGYTFQSGFWRPADVPFRVGDRVETGFHVVQIWVRVDERAEEVLVVYPPDGYWRARPLPTKALGWTAYGSSFLVGPVQKSTRPFVAFKEISFDPAKRSFDLTYADGTSAKLDITTLDRDRMQLDVTFAEPISDKPFAALRSMYVTRFNNDVAEFAVLEKGAASWREGGIMDFKGAEKATDFWAGRLVPSRHNTSAPDMVFQSFSDGSQRPKTWLDRTKPALPEAGAAAVD